MISQSLFISKHVTGPRLLKSSALNFASSSSDLVGVADPLISSITSSLTVAVDAWSVSGTGSALNSPDLASKFFALSLMPYLAFLYFLSRPSTKTPQGALFGFQFLLVFVFATIPAGIVAKVQYHDILANVDWLHGISESLLTVTNILIIQGFRSTRKSDSAVATLNSDSKNVVPSSVTMNDFGSLILLIAGFVTTVLPLSSGLHAEPANALSLPTWLVHSSSIIEWLIAMRLVWDHSQTTGNPAWKGLTWAMLCSNTSGLCACTYHFFFNPPALNWIVNLQALLTLVGNAALALATYRISQYGAKESSQPTGVSSASPLPSPLPLEVESDVQFWTLTFFKALGVAALVKYGELLLDFPFKADDLAAAACIALPTLYTAIKWSLRSTKSPEETKWLL